MAVQQEREEFNKAQRSRNDAQSKFDKVSMAYMDEVERMRVAQEIALKLGPLAGDTTQMDKPWSSLGHIYSQPKAMPSRHLRNSGLTLQVSFDDDFQLVEREYQKMLRNLAGIRDMDVPRAEPIINGEYLEPWLIGKEQGITPLFEKVVVPRIKGMLAIIQPEAKFTPIPGNPNDQADYFLQVSVATKDTNGKVTHRVSSIAIEFKLPPGMDRKLVVNVDRDDELEWFDKSEMPTKEAGESVLDQLAHYVWNGAGEPPLGVRGTICRNVCFCSDYNSTWLIRFEAGDSASGTGDSMPVVNATVSGRLVSTNDTPSVVSVYVHALDDLIKNIMANPEQYRELRIEAINADPGGVVPLPISLRKRKIARPPAGSSKVQKGRKDGDERQAQGNTDDENADSD